MLQASTLKFLAELGQNNNTDWFHANNQAYQAAKDDFYALVGEMLAGIAQFDPGVADLAPKHCVFRINRDIRFSKDKSPYKTNFGAFMVPGGKKSGNAGYYLHVKPDDCFFGGGMYCPPSDKLAKIRQEIDYNAEGLKKVLRSAGFKRHFGELHGSSVKTAPKGYKKDHPDIDLIRMKDYLAVKKFDADRLTQADFVGFATETFKAMKPLNDFLNHAVS